jgi:hypothetical protein
MRALALAPLTLSAMLIYTVAVLENRESLTTRGRVLYNASSFRPALEICWRMVVGTIG